MNRNFVLMAAASTLLLGACSTLDDGYNIDVGSSDSSAIPYTAMGQEPGWTLKISQNTVEYSGDYGETKISAPAASMRKDGNAEIYADGRLRLIKTPGGCSDSMSGQRFADTVELHADGKVLSGCGGAKLAPEKLAGTNWQIISYNEKPVFSGKEANIRFEQDRISGTAGCNRMMGGYKVADDKISFSDTASTMMACSPEEVMQQEQAILGIFRETLTMEYIADGTLQLRGNSGILNLRQSF